MFPNNNKCECLNTGRQLDRQLQDYCNGLIEAQNICLKKKSVPQKILVVLGIKIKYSDYTKCFAPEQLPFGSLHIMVSTHKTSHFIPRQ